MTQHPSPALAAADHTVVETVARTLAVHTGWTQWDTATTCGHTPNGNEPDEEREYWRDLARVALDAMRGLGVIR